MTTEAIDAALGEFHRAIANETAGDAPWIALQRLAQTVVGAKLFTVTTIDLDANLARRLYTNMPEAYPVSGTKPVEVDPWFELVVLGRNLFVANTLAEISRHFADHEQIGSLGCGSCINMPVFVAGKVLGTVNMLHDEHFYMPERVAAVEHLRIPAIAAFLARAGQEPCPQR